MGKIYIARHGQDYDNEEGLLNGRRDRSLTWLGEQQAEDLAKRIKDKLKIDRIYSSPLRRAQETATIIRRRLGLPRQAMLIHPYLIERCFGILEGQPKSLIPGIRGELIRTEHTTFFLEVPGAETFPEVYARAQAVQLWMQLNHPEESVLLVCHGDIASMIRAAYYDMDWREALRKHSRMMNCDIVELKREVRGGCLL